MVKKQIKLTNKMEVIADFFKDLGKVYFVGGCVRDILIGHEPKDYDLITAKTPVDVEAYIKSKGRRVYKVGARFGTLACKVGEDNEMVEITTFRKDEYDGDSRKPAVVFSKLIDEDLSRRDFTINALACDTKGYIKDPFNGLDDLNNKLLKCVGNSKQRFKEDPLRILRGIRFAAKYDLEIEAKTEKRIESCRWELLRLSKERIISELNNMLLLPEPKSTIVALRLLWDLNTWQVIEPGMQLQKDFNQNSPSHDFVLNVHTLKVVLNVKYEPILGTDLPCLWAALLHDIAKPFTQTLHKSGERYNYINHEVLGAELANDFCIKYKFSNNDRELIVKYIKGHLEPTNWMKPFDDGGKKK